MMSVVFRENTGLFPSDWRKWNRKVSPPVSTTTKKEATMPQDKTGSTRPFKISLRNTGLTLLGAFFIFIIFISFYRLVTIPWEEVNPAVRVFQE